MNDPSIKCRVCWETKETNICVLVTTKWAKESVKTIKDVILLCVPWMTIQDDNYLCKPCLWQLKFTYDFIERCLKTENIFNEKNNTEKLTLEDIFDKSLRNGNKIQIIFENPVDIQTENGSEDTDVNLGETVDVSDDNVEDINVEVDTSETAMSSEHDYCIKKGAQLYVSCIKIPQIIDTQSKEQNSLEKCKNFSNKEEKENIITIDDNLSSNDTVDFLGESNTAEKVVDPGEPTKKKRYVKKTKPDTPVVSQESQPNNELKELLDIAPIDIYFLTTPTEMSAEEQNDLVRDGINILNMSKNITKKKRTIYLSRDLCRSHHTCSKCHITFLSRCDYFDHIYLHRRGTIKTPGPPLHTCKFCSETFSLDIEFRAHTKRFHGISSPHDCPKCKKRYKTIRLLNDHMEMFKDQEKCVFKCTRCNAEFSTMYSWKRHENDGKDAPTCNYKKCRVCLEKFTKEDFKIHCIEVHPNYLCSICGKSFIESASLATHQKNVHDAVQTMCHECGKILSHPKLLAHHMETVHGTGEKNFICDQCPQQFVCNRYLQNHLKRHLKTEKVTRSYRCDPCGKNYKKKESLRQHTRMFHLGVKQFTCPMCSEGFLRRDYLNRHIRAHEKYVTNTCTICKKSFGSDWRLESHMFAGHDENGKSLEISGCRKKSDGLKVRYGPYRAPYQCVCKICNKVLCNKATLEKHYKAHLNIRESKCDICGIVFQGSIALNHHKKLHNKPNYQFSCNICHAYKSSNIELENHMRDVHKNKKYKCSICSETFGRKHLLLSHETIAHKEELYKKEALLKILQKNQILVPSEGVDRRKTKKGIKLGNLEVDVDTVLSTIANQTEEFEMVAGSSQIISAGELYRNFTGNQTPTYSRGENVTVLENEYRSMEDATACRVLEEENSNGNLYISYRD